MDLLKRIAQNLQSEDENFPTHPIDKSKLYIAWILAQDRMVVGEYVFLYKNSEQEAVAAIKEIIRISEEASGYGADHFRWHMDSYDEAFRSEQERADELLTMRPVIRDLLKDGVYFDV